MIPYIQGEGDPEPEVCVLWEAIYDELPPDFPDTSTHRLCFLSDHMLYDLGEDATFAFRLHGSDWDNDDDDEDEPGADGNDAPNCGHSEDAEEITTSAAALVDGLMSSIISKHVERMASLPHIQQTFVASVVARSKESLAEKIEAALAAKKARGVKSRFFVSYFVGACCKFFWRWSFCFLSHQVSPAPYRRQRWRPCSLELVRSFKLLKQQLQMNFQSSLKINCP